MNLISRIKNLWRLSSYDMPKVNKVGGFSIIGNLLKPKQEVEIIKRETPVESFLKENQNGK